MSGIYSHHSVLQNPVLQVVRCPLRVKSSLRYNPQPNWWSASRALRRKVAHRTQGRISRYLEPMWFQEKTRCLLRGAGRAN